MGVLVEFFIVITSLAGSDAQTLVESLVTDIKSNLGLPELAVLNQPNFPFFGGRFARLCASISCSRGTECRIVQKCPNCFPQPRCIPPSLIPPLADNICRRENFDASILVETFGNQFRGLLCSSVGNSCPRGSTCVRGFRGRSKCCYFTSLGAGLGGIEGAGGIGGIGEISGIRRVGRRFPGGGRFFNKPGFCPTPQLGSAGVCGGAFCTTDGFCPGIQKCCSSLCGGDLCTVPARLPQSIGRNQCGVCPAGTVCRQTGFRGLARCVPSLLG